MADVMPNYKVEQQRLKMRVAETKAMIEKQKLEMMEMVHRKAKLLENIKSAKGAISGYEIDLKGLEKEHGPIDEEESS